MDENEFNEMIKKAKNMIDNNQVPDNIKEMINNIQNSNTNNQNNNMDNSNYSNNTNFNNSSNSNINMETIMKMQNVFSNMQNNKDDDMSKLLISLKPYLRDAKKDKIDDYIKLILMGKMTKIMENLNNNNISNNNNNK